MGAGKDEGEIHGEIRWILFFPRGFLVCFVFGPNFSGEVFLVGGNTGGV